MPLGIHNPLPSSLSSECRKVAKILASFVDPRQAFGPDKVIPPEILANAKGLAVLTVIKAGFIGTGRFGSGVVVARLADGTWSAPSAIATAGAGVGGQLGLELTDFVFILNDAAAVRTFSQVGTLTLGGNVSVAAGPVGRNAEVAGAASARGVAGVFSYSVTKGLFAGVSLEGSMLVERKDANEKLYNSRVSARQLLGGSIRPPPSAAPLLNILNSRAFSGAGRMYGGDEMYNDIPIYDDRHDDVVWEGRRGAAYGENHRRAAPPPPTSRSYGYAQDRDSMDDYEYRDRPRRANTWADDVYDRPYGGFGSGGGGGGGSPGLNRAASTRAPRNDSFDAFPVSRSRSNTAPFDEDYEYSDHKPSRPSAPKPIFGQRTGGAPALRQDQAIALYTFDADQEGDLGFRKGDIITILQRTQKSEDWWTGRIGDRVGIFPRIPILMQEPSTRPVETGGYSTRRGHGPHLSISDPSHHVTEAIGHMYDDDYDKNDSKRLSYISSPRGESITTIPPSLAGSASPTSPQSLQLQSHLSEVNHHQPDDGEDHQRPPPLTSPKPLEQRDSSSPSSPGSPGSPGSSKTDTATTSFPLNDVDYESNPAAVAQELNNLAAIRRMSMDVAATGDPDLPDFASSVSSIAPAPSADENDASRLFWVPARLHPELAPGEFKSFLDNRSDRIKRRSTEFSSLSPEGPDSAGGLRRKRSMLSREIDSSHGYTDGAERLERKRSESSDKSLSPNLQELESMVDDSKKSNNRDPASVLDSMQTLVLAEGEDKPILPPTPRAPGLRRSTRTQYRKAGSVKNGERPTYPKRLPQSSSSESNQSVPSIVTSSADQPILGLTRVSTDPTPSAKRAPLTKTAQQQQQQQQQQQSTRHSETAAEDYSSESRRTSSDHEESRRGSNERPNSDPKLPSIVETPPVDNRSQKKPSGHGPDQTQKRSSPIQQQQQQQQQQDNGSSKRSGHSRGKDTNLNDFANNPQLIPGNSTRTDSLSFIPTFSEDHSKKTESKKSKDRKDSEGGSRKSSWHWLLGTEEKDKDKEKKREKDKDGDASKKIKAKLVEKVHDTTNHNLNHNNHASASSPSSSTSSAAAAAAAAVAGTTNGTSDSSPRGRESIVIDRLDPKLEEERKKDSNNRRTSSETKKEKESGLFSSLFGGGRKKHGDGHHKKSLSRTLSPDPPVRILRPDLDYPWTRFSILEERAIYRMAHIKLANPRRALHSQVLLSNFMYSYLAKVQQMQPQMVLATSAAQRHQRAREKQEEEYQQYQRYQEEYGDNPYNDSQMYDDYSDEHHYETQSRGYENGNNPYTSGYNYYGHSTFGDDVQLDDDDDNDMW